jgi:CHASE2 domain-containing sensor protein
MARFIPHLSNREALRQAPLRRSLEDVVRSAGAGEPVFRGKTVLVGVEQLRDTLETPLDLVTPRYGFEFQADAINALLSERVVMRVKRLGQAMFVIGMAALTALIRLSGPGMARRRLSWVPGCLAIVSFVVAVLAYRFLDVLASPAFPAAACLATWAALGYVDRRWSDGS